MELIKKTLKLTLTGAFLSLCFIACDDDDSKPNLRTKLDYNLLTAETEYPALFVDASGATTVDLSEGNNRYKMFSGLNSYSSTSISGNTKIDAARLKNMFSNTNSPFTDIPASNISGAALNAANVQLKNVTASSRTAAAAETVRTKIESLFTEIETASNSVTEIAAKGKAGKLGTYLVDAKGIEIIQIIQKSLIGSLQLDYIGNVLLNDGLDADNHSLVGDKAYTQLEHNWDEAYGFLTLNPIYLKGSTDLAKGTTESFGGSYIWEYNKTGYPKIFPAFLKGRAAIVNNDKAEIEAQATIIRTEFERAIAGAALGYLDKWKDGSLTEAQRAHAIGEGLGFVYSLRFANLHKVDDKFSDDLLVVLVGSANGFWDLDAAKIAAASDAIKAKFGM